MAANQLVNAITGGDSDESLSSRAARARERGSRVGRVACRVLDVLDPREADRVQGDHCDIALRNHLNQTAIAYQNEVRR